MQSLLKRKNSRMKHTKKTLNEKNQKTKNSDIKKTHRKTHE